MSRTRRSHPVAAHWRAVCPRRVNRTGSHAIRRCLFIRHIIHKGIYHYRFRPCSFARSAERGRSCSFSPTSWRAHFSLSAFRFRFGVDSTMTVRPDRSPRLTCCGDEYLIRQTRPENAKKERERRRRKIARRRSVFRRLKIRMPPVPSRLEQRFRDCGY